MIKGFLFKRKVLLGVALPVVVLGSYFIFRGGSTAEAKYVLGTVTKGTIISSITGSGQVSTSNQIDLKPKVSGELVYLSAVKGQMVRTGQILAQVDARDAQQAVRDAQISLESAELSLTKLKLNQESGVTDLGQSITDAELALDQSYQNGFNAVSSAFLEIPTTLAGLADVFSQTTLESGNTNANAYENMVSEYSKDDVRRMVSASSKEYTAVNTQYQVNFNHYKNASRSSEPTVVESLLEETLATVEAMDDLAKHDLNLLDTVVLDLRTHGTKSVSSTLTAYQSNVGQYLNTLNSLIANLRGVSNSFDAKRQALAKAQQSLSISAQSNPLDIATQENSVKQRQAALMNAQSNLANYYIRAPFAGKIAAMDVKRGDSVSGSTIIATVISPQDVAEISLNEVEIATIKLGQKATLTFDAAEGLSLTGTVIDIDDLGTVSQGVVTYKVKVGFDTQDPKVKPGMSVSTAIITDSKQDVLLVPNAAVKSSGGTSYVQIPEDASTAEQLLASTANATGITLSTLPQQQAIEVGVANDSVTEVVGGLKEGDIIVVRTITPSKTATTTQNNSLIPVGGRTTPGSGTRGGFQGR